MILRGHVTEIGQDENGGTATIALTDVKSVKLTGLPMTEALQLSRMVGMQIVIEFRPMHYRDEEPPRRGYSNYDEETGIKKTGEI